LYDVWLRIEPPFLGGETEPVIVRDHEPDSIQITSATYDTVSRLLEVTATANFAPDTLMTVSVDGRDAGSDLEVDPFILEHAMSYDAREGNYWFEMDAAENVIGRRITISTAAGGAFNDMVIAL
jgi:hypothetical protein